MKASLFSGRTVKEALRKVRDALGPDAVIIGETRRNCLVEITASVEFPEAGMTSTPRRAGVTVEFGDRLRLLGFDASFIDAVASSIELTARWETIERQVARLIGVAPRPVALARGRVRLIGPPGSG
ncbi:MAG: hypothetical protein NT024_01920, partial [Proteobacteria bacterium]|nr:hypothetical protein [Pseudomonadota bacterium]